MHWHDDASTGTSCNAVSKVSDWPTDDLIPVTHWIGRLFLTTFWKIQSDSICFVIPLAHPSPTSKQITLVRQNGQSHNLMWSKPYWPELYIRWRARDSTLVTSHERHGVRQLNCLFNSMFILTMVTSNVRIIWPLWGNPPTTSGIHRVDQ